MTNLNINFTPPSSIPENGYIVTYKVFGSSDTPTTVLFSSIAALPFLIENVTEGVNFDVTVQSDCNGLLSTIENVQSNAVFQYVENTSSCESTDAFHLEKSVTGFNLPLWSFWDSVSGRFYIVDSKGTNVQGIGCNVYSFDPSTFNTIADAQKTNTPLSADVRWAVFDESRRKIYYGGKETSGVVIYDLATDNYTMVPYSYNFSELSTTCSTQNIVCSQNQCIRTGASLQPNTLILTTSHAGFARYNGLWILDLNTEEIIIPTGADISTYARTGSLLKDIPNPMELGKGSEWLSAAAFVEINNQYWVFQQGVYAQKQPTECVAVKDVLIYDLDFNYIESITIDGVLVNTGWAGNNNDHAYYRVNYYDKNLNKFFIYDYGAKKFMTIDTNTKTVVNTVDNIFNPPDVLPAFVYHAALLKNKITTELVLSGSFRPLTHGVAPGIHPVTYVIDDNGDFVNMRDNTVYRDLTYSPTYNLVCSPTIAIPVSCTSGNTTASAINLYTTSTTNLTGKKDILTVIFKNITNNISIGEIKINTIDTLGASYIPSYIDTITCVPTYTLNCPVIYTNFITPLMHYEFSLEPQTYHNIDVALVRLIQKSTDGVTPFTIIDLGKETYYNGTLEAQLGFVNTVSIELVNAVGEVIKDCVDVITIPAI